MARYDPVKECAQDRTGQGISSIGSATCVGDADITYPVASRNSPPVDERSWPTGHQAGDPFSSSSSSSGQFDSNSSLAQSRGHHHHHRSYVPYPISSTSTVTPSSSRSESHRGWLSTQSLHPSPPTTPLTDGQETSGSPWMPLDFASPFPFSNYPPSHDWHNSPSMAETPRTPSIPARVSSLPPLPVIQTDPAWEDVSYPIAGTSTRSAASSPAHSPFRDTPTPVDHPEGGSKGKKRSRGRYRKEDPADGYLRESTEDGNRLWTCMWVEPSSHGTPDPQAAQNICGHQAPKSNARQHVKSRHLKLRPYTCPECGRTWRDQGARYNHRVREHGYVPKKPKRWLDDDVALEGGGGGGGASSDNSHLNVSFVMESVGQ